MSISAMLGSDPPEPPPPASAAATSISAVTAPPPPPSSSSLPPGAGSGSGSGSAPRDVQTPSIFHRPRTTATPPVLSPASIHHALPPVSAPGPGSGPIHNPPPRDRGLFARPDVMVYRSSGPPEPMPPDDRFRAFARPPPFADAFGDRPPPFGSFSMLGNARPSGQPPPPPSQQPHLPPHPPPEEKSPGQQQAPPPPPPPPSSSSSQPPQPPIARRRSIFSPVTSVASVTSAPARQSPAFGSARLPDTGAFAAGLRYGQDSSEEVKQQQARFGAHIIEREGERARPMWEQRLSPDLRRLGGPGPTVGPPPPPPPPMPHIPAPGPGSDYGYFANRSSSLPVPQSTHTPVPKHDSPSESLPAAGLAKFPAPSQLLSPLASSAPVRTRSFGPDELRRREESLPPPPQPSHPAQLRPPPPQPQPAPRSLLGIPGERRGVSPLPQAVQGAQAPPSDDSSIKSELGRVFSGIGSGVGVSTATNPGSGASTPSIANSPFCKDTVMAGVVDVDRARRLGVPPPRRVPKSREEELRKPRHHHHHQ